MLLHLVSFQCLIASFTDKEHHARPELSTYNMQVVGMPDDEYDLWCLAGEISVHSWLSDGWLLGGWSPRVNISINLTLLLLCCSCCPLLWCCSIARESGEITNKKPA